MSASPKASGSPKPCSGPRMFEAADTPRVFALPLGVDFPKALIDGLNSRLEARGPEALARVRIIVNTRRMARRIRAIFDAGPPRLLPRISSVTELGQIWDLADIPPPVSRLERQLELVQLVSTLLDRQPDIAPHSALFDLAGSLADLMDEMHGEGISPQVLENLNITDHSGHWARIKSFLEIVKPYFETGTHQPDTETRQRLVVEHLVNSWQDRPPEHPVIIAGSTGSRGATQMLMRAVARLPQGAVILPGFDFDMPPPVWDRMQDAMTGEDHPQFRFLQLANALALPPADIRNWHPAAKPANAARNRLISLALRPAPITDQWLTEGPGLSDIPEAMQNVTLLEAQSPRQEALAIAMRLRQAAEDGKTAALITPDRNLTRQVTAVLDRWNIEPDDSAGIGLHLTAPGRLLRHVAELFRQPLTTEALLALLKHPLAHGGSDRGAHLRLTHELELHLRRKGIPFPEAADLQVWAAVQKDPHASRWITWLIHCFTGWQRAGSLALTGCVEQHIALVETIARGPDMAEAPAGAGKLWENDSGLECRQAMDEFLRAAAAGSPMTAQDYSDFLGRFLAGKELRHPGIPHPGILIWGTLEARVQGADLLILAGLNEGTWPETPKPDPWLNRQMRKEAGLLLPEQRIGLSAHDFEQAICAGEIWLTRSVRSEDAETIVSRWLNRIQNLMTGLPDQGGQVALAAMKARGTRWLDLARALEAPGQTDPAPRPAPAPPVAARPRKLSVTEIQRLIRDPYAIYGRHVLKLRPLQPLRKLPDALLRGTVLHMVLENFIRDVPPAQMDKAALMAIADKVIAKAVPWPESRAIWQARLDRVADWFIAGELQRQAEARPARFEAKGKLTIRDLDFELVGKADRIDIDKTGRLYIYDYKTGSAPSKKQQKEYDPQLLLEAVIATYGRFEGILSNDVAQAVYIGLGAKPDATPAPLEEHPVYAVREKFHGLIASFMQEGKGYISRRSLFMKDDTGDYDHLARFGEWDITADPEIQKVGG